VHFRRPDRPIRRTERVSTRELAEELVAPKERVSVVFRAAALSSHLKPDILQAASTTSRLLASSYYARLDAQPW
jgi:hypothetical protein